MIQGVEWVVDYLDDIRSDFSVFHRVDDIEAMNSIKFARMVVRLSAYAGVLAVRVSQEIAEMEEAEQQPQPASGGREFAGGFPVPAGASTTPPSELAPISDPAFAGWIEHAEVNANA